MPRVGYLAIASSRSLMALVLVFLVFGSAACLEAEVVPAGGVGPSRTALESQADLLNAAAGAFEHRSSTGTFEDFDSVGLPGVEMKEATFGEFTLSTSQGGKPYCLRYQAEDGPRFEVTVYGSSMAEGADEPDDCSAAFSGSGPPPWVPYSFDYPTSDDQPWVWTYGTGSEMGPPATCTTAGEANRHGALTRIATWNPGGAGSPWSEDPVRGAADLLASPMLEDDPQRASIWLRLTSECLVEYATGYRRP